MELETWHAPPGDRIPNHPRFAVLLYRGGDATDPAAARARFAAAGADELILIPCSPDPGQVDLLAEAVA